MPTITPAQCKQKKINKPDATLASFFPRKLTQKKVSRNFEPSCDLSPVMYGPVPVVMGLRTCSSNLVSFPHMVRNGLRNTSKVTQASVNSARAVKYVVYAS